ncbi:Uncharacterised protein [Serratia plymuthica]|uniref:Uncharacterized protein n=1 Tax=Serratia plymuthica TaxID=82996 RepID=A0A2X4V501_SERPL|nr:Uncharacterised protein [Serratia plymuthica]
MPMPDARLKEPARGDYITRHGLKQFPLDSQTLALDYRQSPPDSAALLLTAARQQELQQWLHCCVRPIYGRRWSTSLLVPCT